MDKDETAVHKRRVSSGLEELDRLLGNLFIGDNVLWYEDSGSFSTAFCYHFIKESLAQKKPLIYVTFDRSPKNVVSFLGPLAENQNLTILDCFTNGKGDRSEVFDKFYEKDGALWPHQVVKVNEPANAGLVADAIYGLHGNFSGDVHFILDSLTGMQSLWGGEDSVIDFYVRTCPRLYELDTIAYWLIEKGAHSNRFKANINKVAQVAIDLSVRKGKPSLKIIKAENRASRFQNEQHDYVCEGTDISFESQKPLLDKFDLGARIKGLRVVRGLSQKQLAAKAGLTPSTISQVEKNQISPSLPALFRLAESLEVEVATMFRDVTGRQEPILYPASSRKSAALPRHLGQGRNVAMTEMLLPEDITVPARPQLITIAPGGKLTGHFVSHKGSEFGFLLRGRLEMTVEHRNLELGPGDVVFLQRDTPGAWFNPGEEPAELLWFLF